MRVNSVRPMISQPDACAIVSSSSTPGISGWPGKWPSKIVHSVGTIASARIVRAARSMSMIRSMSRKYSRRMPEVTPPLAATSSSMRVHRFCSTKYCSVVALPSLTSCVHCSSGILIPKVLSIAKAMSRKSRLSMPRSLIAWLSGLIVSRGMSHVSAMILATVSNVDAIGKSLIDNAFRRSSLAVWKTGWKPPRAPPSAAEVACPYSERGGRVQCRREDLSRMRRNCAVPSASLPRAAGCDIIPASDRRRAGVQQDPSFEIRNPGRMIMSFRLAAAAVVAAIIAAPGTAGAQVADGAQSVGQNGNDDRRDGARRVRSDGFRSRWSIAPDG